MNKLVLLSASILASLLFSCTTEDNIDVSTYPEVLTKDDIMALYDISLDTTGASETCERTTYFDGSDEIEYTYEREVDTPYDPFFMSVSSSEEPNIADAKTAYSLLSGTFDLTVSVMDAELEYIDSIPLGGDESKYALLKVGDIPSGILFISRRDKTVYYTMVAGLYIADHTLLKEAILPKVALLD